MLEFPNGVNDERDEVKFQEWLRAHEDGGYVIGEERPPHGRTVHKPTCSKVSFPLSGRIKKRQPLVCCDNRDQLAQWSADAGNPGLGELNECYECKARV